MYTGTLTKMDADDAFAGDIASLDFDFAFTMVPNLWLADTVMGLGSESLTFWVAEMLELRCRCP